MNVRCGECKRVYNDEFCWTLCPHGPLEEPQIITLDMATINTIENCLTEDQNRPIPNEVEFINFCPRCDTLITRHGLCQHQIIHVEAAQRRSKQNGKVEDA